MPAKASIVVTATAMPNRPARLKVTRMPTMMIKRRHGGGFHRDSQTLDHVGTVSGDRGFGDGVHRALARCRVVFGDPDDASGDDQANDTTIEQVARREAAEVRVHVAEDQRNHGPQHDKIDNTAVAITPL